MKALSARSLELSKAVSFKSGVHHNEASHASPAASPLHFPGSFGREKKVDWIGKVELREDEVPRRSMYSDLLQGLKGKLSTTLGSQQRRP